MCGIAGVLNRDERPVSEEILSSISQVIAHRGPDDHGSYINGEIGLAHRRLSIIDLSEAGRQPIVTPDSRYVISYNGEVYNYREIRKELIRLGHTFQSQTDTEVVLQSFVEWKEAAITRFNGMFAFAIWDQKNRQLTLARDRYGIKPLYYAVLQNAILFGSEVKSLLRHPGLSVEVDKEALLEYFTFQNILSEKTLFQGVQILPAGSYLQITPGLTRISPTKYWDFNFFEPESPLAKGEYIEELSHLFRQAVQRQLVSDVDIGSYLSGGMDSGSITAIASRTIPSMHSFTCGFDMRGASEAELHFDERDRAESMSRLFQTEHHDLMIRPSDLESAFSRLAWHIEEPRVSQSYPNFYAAQLAGRYVKVVLSGAGGDELFGGYPWRYAYSHGCKSSEEYLDNYFAYWQRIIEVDSAFYYFKPIWNDIKNVSTRDIFRKIYKKGLSNQDQSGEFLHQSLYFEAKTFLHGLLVMEDKLSMAHGLETRVPFLDNDLVDFAMRLPADLKVGEISQEASGEKQKLNHQKNQNPLRTSEGKLILRHAMNRFLPSEVTQRNKQGFTAPDASWFRNECFDFVHDNLCTYKSPIYDYLDRQAIEPRLEEHFQGKKNQRHFIWSLLSFHFWCSNFLTHLPAGAVH